MNLQQVTLLIVCVLHSTHWSFAVVNTVKSIAGSDSNSKSIGNNAATQNAATQNAAAGTSSDLTTANSDKEANRRELPSGGLSDSYGIPIPSNSYGPPVDSYVPSVPSNLGLPAPVYGVPNGPVKNIVYPALPPDIPPPLPLVTTSFSGAYGPPRPVYGPPLKLQQFIPPSHHKPHFHKPSFGPAPIYGPPKSPRPIYGPPKPQYGIPPKPIYGPPKLPKPVYGPPLKLNFVPPKPLFVSSKPAHGPIKLTGSFGAPLATYGPPHTGPLFIPPKDIYGPPKEIYGPPKIVHGPPPAPVYGPPEPISHGPPHPGIPAPPTPPDIKYDGWQPIPGLVSRPPSDLYGAPHNGGGQIDIGFNVNGISPPPLGISGHTDLPFTYASSFAHGIDGNVGGIVHKPSDSYGAPLNSVTGSGGVAGLSVNDHGSADGFGNVFGGGSFSGHDNSLSVIKSIGYELFPTGSQGLNFDGINAGAHVSTGILDSYGAPPANAYSPDGPYAAAFTHKAKSVSSLHNSHLQGLSLSSNGIGLIPPSGIYGVPPGGQYGAPMLSPPKNIIIPSGSYGAPALNALDINPPKSPVVFREPVPIGLIESIGQSVAHKDAHGIENNFPSFQGQSYIPPPVPDITNSKSNINIGGNVDISLPSDLYSLPNIGNPISFQSTAFKTGAIDVSNDLSNSFNLVNDQGANTALTSYTAPLGAIDSSYGAPLQPQALTASIDQSHGFDLASLNVGSTLPTYTIPGFGFPTALPHDCSQYKSQPLPPPQPVYGLPSSSASGYTASISTLNTNIGGYQVPQLGIGNGDLQAVHSLTNPTLVQADLPTNSIDVQGKSLAQDYFGKDSEVQRSQEIQVANGLQTIPVQGALGSYTLQIQSADSLAGQQGGISSVPHEQVLSEGLLQSILAAIEQPQQNQFAQPQPIQYGDVALQQIPFYPQQQTIPDVDEEAQHSDNQQIVVTPPPTTTTTTTTTTENEIATIKNVEQSTTENPVPDQSIQLIDNNEIALFFSNNEPQNVSSQQNEKTNYLTENGKQTIRDESTENVRNGQQYGSFVSFKTPHSSYVYGELKTSNGTQVITPPSKVTQ